MGLVGMTGPEMFGLGGTVCFIGIALAGWGHDHEACRLGGRMAAVGLVLIMLGVGAGNG